MAYEDEEEATCTGCGAAQSLWTGNKGSGFVAANGEVYCCEACAAGQTCGCNIERSESLVKRQSA